jgi:hypothetical protein
VNNSFAGAEKMQLVYFGRIEDRGELKALSQKSMNKGEDISQVTLRTCLKSKIYKHNHEIHGQFKFKAMRSW